MDVREEFKMLENSGNIFDIMCGKRKTPPSFSNEYAEPIQVPFEQPNHHSNTIIEDVTPLSIIYPFKNDVEQSNRAVFQCYDIGDGELMYAAAPEPTQPHPAETGIVQSGTQTDQPTQPPTEQSQHGAQRQLIMSADPPTVTVDEGASKQTSPKVGAKKLGARKTVQPPQQIILAKPSGVKVADEGEARKTIRPQLIMSAESPSVQADDDEGSKKGKSPKVGTKGARKTVRPQPIDSAEPSGAKADDEGEKKQKFAKVGTKGARKTARKVWED